MMKFLASHRAGLGILACASSLLGGLLLALDTSKGTIWIVGFVLFCVSFIHEMYVCSSPYQRIVQFSLPWHDRQPDLDERERGLRSFAFEVSYILLVLGNAILLATLMFFNEITINKGAIFLLFAYLGVGFTLPMIVLEWAAPSAGFYADLDNAED